MANFQFVFLKNTHGLVIIGAGRDVVVVSNISGEKRERLSNLALPRIIVSGRQSNRPMYPTK